MRQACPGLFALPCFRTLEQFFSGRHSIRSSRAATDRENTRMEKNQEFIVTIEDLTNEGEGISHAEGFPLFVKDAVIGDVARIRVTKTKKTYGYARLMEIITPSPDRIQPACPVARRCGGCTLQAMSCESQLAFKHRKVEQNLIRLGGLKDVRVEPVIGSDELYRYRNKTQVPFGTDRSGKTVAGFYAGRSHEIVECDDCLISPEINGRIIRLIKSFIAEYRIKPYNEENGRGILRHVLIRNGFSTGQIMVCLVINAAVFPHAEVLVSRLKTIPGMTDICCSVNRERTNVIMGQEIISLYGPGYIEDTIGDLTFRISPLSFYQVNPRQTEKLYAKALEFAGLTGNETVWDLYCGIGTISLFLAQKAKHVYGVEIVPEAIDNARENARLNGLSENTTFFVGKSEEILPAWYKEHGERADVIVVDPPRKGCDETLLRTIAEMAPDRLVYVSCDSATLARDLKYLTANGFQVDKVQPVEMFTFSNHVESIALLERVSNRKADAKVHIDLDLEDYYRIKDAQGKDGK